MGRWQVRDPEAWMERMVRTGVAARLKVRWFRIPLPWPGRSIAFAVFTGKRRVMEEARRG